MNQNDHYDENRIGKLSRREIKEEIAEIAVECHLQKEKGLLIRN